MAAQIIAGLFLALLFIFIVIPTYGLPEHITQDPRYPACMKRGIIKVLYFLTVVGALLLVVIIAAIVLGLT